MATLVRDSRVSTLRKPVVAIDWDGTCVTNTWPKQSREWMPGAVNALHALSNHVRIVIHTSRIAPFHWPAENVPRTAGEVQAEINYIREMLDSVGLTGVDIWEKPWKPGADVYVDDKAERYTGRPGSWKAMTEKLLARIGADGDS